MLREGGNKLNLIFNWPNIPNAVAGGVFFRFLCGQLEQQI